jgi:hypothetical protein
MPRPRRDGTPARTEPNRRKLSDAFIKTVKHDSDRVVVYWDTFQRGLALAVQPSGHRAWKCIYTIRQRGARWYHLGDARAIALADARRLASKIMYQVAEGGDGLQLWPVVRCFESAWTGCRSDANRGRAGTGLCM